MVLNNKRNDEVFGSIPKNGSIKKQALTIQIVGAFLCMPFRAKLCGKLTILAEYPGTAAHFFATCQPLKPPDSYSCRDHRLLVIHPLDIDQHRIVFHLAEHILRRPGKELVVSNCGNNG